MSYRRSKILGLALAGAVALAACSEENVINLPPAEVSVEVEPSAAQLDVGQTVQLTGIVRNSTSQAVSFTSTNNQVATVSATGLVTAVAPGTATIRVQSTTHADAPPAVATITVNAPPPPPEIVVTVQPATVPNLVRGATVQLAATVTGSANQNVTWESTNTNVATVSATGLVTASATNTGPVVIRARSVADNTKVGSSVVTVVNPPQTQISIASITTGATFIPVNPDNVFGQIEITANVDAPQGSNVNAIELLIDGVVVGRQGFTSTRVFGEAENQAETELAAVQVVFSVVTNQFCTAVNAAVPVVPALGTLPAVNFNCSAIGLTRWRNGVHTVTVRAQAAGQASPVAQHSTNLTYNNADGWYMRVTTSVAQGVTDVVGRLWNAGDVGVIVTPVLYNNLGAGGATLTVPAGTTVVTLGNLPGASTLAGQNVTFSRNQLIGGTTNGVAYAETPLGGVAYGIASLYSNGQAGPGIFNVVAFQQNGFPALPVLIGGQAQVIPTLLLDNNAPQWLNGQPMMTDQFTGINPGGLALTVAAGSYVDMACCWNNWLGSAKPLADFHNVVVAPATTNAPVDGGVDAGRPVNAVRYYVGAVTATTAALLATAPVVTPAGSNLAETTSNGDLRAVAQAQDGLGNITEGLGCAPGGGACQGLPRAVGVLPSPGNPFAVADPDGGPAVAQMGVDRNAPTLTAAPPAGTMINQARTSVAATALTFVYTISDNLSAFGPWPFVSVIDQLFAPVTGGAVANAQQRCFLLAGEPATTFSATAGCRRVSRSLPITIPGGTGDGEFSLTGMLQDQGGNRTADNLRQVIRDGTAPTPPAGGQVVMPANVVGGQAASYSLISQENVSLWNSNLFQTFGALTLDVTMPASDGVAFSGNIVTNKNITAAASFIRATEATTAGHAPSGVITSATGAGFRVRNTAHTPALTAGVFNIANTELNFAAAYGAVPAPGPSFANGGVNPLTDVFTFGPPAITAAITLCNGGTGCGAGVPTARTVTVTATGSGVVGAQLQPPFQRVQFYYIDRNGVVRLFATVQGFSVTTAAGINTYSWTTTISGTNPQGTGQAISEAPFASGVFAVGINAAGDALVSQTSNLTVQGNIAFF